jgi:ubiquinone/menaquinone biosynthesis C-methylase UbiE
MIFYLNGFYAGTMGGKITVSKWYQKEYWEKERNRRSPSHPVIKAFAEPKVHYINRILASRGSRKFNEMTLLDVGCGNGFFTYYFEPIYDTYGIDYSEFMLSINPCKKRACGSATDLPFAENSFDIVFCSNLLHHLEEPIDAVREMRRVSRKYVVLSEPTERVIEICEEITRRKLDIAFICMSRVGRFVNKEILKVMKRAGCKQISFGIESGSQKVLNAMKKGTTIKDARDSIKLVKDVGIKTHASYMIGNIGETKETIKQTIEFAKELDTDIAAFFVTSPLPGTELWNEAVSKGYIKEDFEWIDFSPLSKNESVLDLPGLCSKEIKKWHRRVVKEYYLRPKYILKQVFGQKGEVDILNLIDGFKILLRLS